MERVPAFYEGNELDVIVSVTHFGFKIVPQKRRTKMDCKIGDFEKIEYKNSCTDTQHKYRKAVVQMQ
eukprot:3333372-Rhodomonas_salina.3